MDGSGLVTHAVRRHSVIADAALALVVAVLLFPVTARAIWDGSWSRGLQVGVLAVVVLGHLAVAVRRLAPVLALGVGGVVVLVLVLTPPLDTGAGVDAFSAVLVPSVLVFPVLLYTVAAWCPSRTSWVALGVAALGAVLVVARLWGADYLTVSQPGLASASRPVHSWALFLLLALGATVVVPWMLGRHRRLRLLYVAELEQRAVREEEERVAAVRAAADHERHRIAREMHDVVAHSLAVMVRQAEGGRMVSDQDPARAASVLDTISGVGRDAMRDMRGILAVLGDEEADTAAPQPTLADLPALVDGVGRAGLEVRLSERGSPRVLAPSGQLAAYRLVQEALTNVLKHAGTSAPVHVDLRWQADALEIGVRSRPTQRASAYAGPGRGLSGMRDRVAALGGAVEVTATEREFAVHASLPAGER